MHGVKPLDRKKFEKALHGFLYEGYTLEQAAKCMERSIPTAQKYMNMYLLGEEFPKGLFKDEKQ